MHVDAAAYGMAFGAAAAGSLGPDLDHPFSLASFGIPTALLSSGGGFLLLAWILPRSTSLQWLDLSLLGNGVFVAARLAVSVGLLLLVASLVFALFGHRGPVHSLAFGLAMTLLFTVGLAIMRAPLWLWAPFAWGWVAHLMADATTSHGVPYLLWPLGSGLDKQVMPAPRMPAPAHKVSTPHPPAVPKAAVTPPAPQLVDSPPLCPSCGVPMVRRVSKRGAHPGSSFYGCVNFPRCRQTRPINPPGDSGLTSASS